MRKVIVGAAVAGLLLGAASAVSAQDWSIGIGGVFSSNFGGGNKYESEGVPTLNTGYTRNDETSTPYSGEGFDVFFAAKYAEASVGFVFAKYVRNTELSLKNQATGSIEKSTEEEKTSTININLGLWLKYPYNLSNAFKLFPIAGIDYEICGSIMSKNEETFNANDLSRAWFKAGVGSDIYLGERIYLHPVVLYGVGWKNSIERGLVNAFHKDIDIKLSHGLTARFNVGYRFDFD